MQDSAPSSISSFADLARGYCAWCEGASLGMAPEAQAAIWLARLYAAALVLPEVGCENEDDVPDLPKAEADRAESNLAPFRGWYYRECFDPDPRIDDEPSMGDVGDDLLDIYKDLKGGLMVFDSGAVNDALWHWSFLYRIHWGHHAAGGLFALHCMHVSKGE